MTPQTAENVSFDRISTVLGIFLKRNLGVSDMATTEVHTFPSSNLTTLCLYTQVARLEPG